MFRKSCSSTQLQQRALSSSRSVYGGAAAPPVAGRGIAPATGRTRRLHLPQALAARRRRPTPVASPGTKQRRGPLLEEGAVAGRRQEAGARMGANGSARRVSFGMDEHERVTMLQGLRLSDKLITRMKDVPQPMSKLSSSTSAGHDSQWEGGMPLNSGTKEELYQRYEKEKVLMEEELSQFAQQEQVEAMTELGEHAGRGEEQQDMKQLADQLEKKEAALQKLEAFYKEQLDLIEQKNTEYYRHSSEQFNEAASAADTRVKRRNYEPLCLNLQQQILHCYLDNPQLTLKCSDFAKEYSHCIREAQKTLLVNQG
ncbi:MICOS complex subunit MIC25 [Amblyraja radiata]|uniref:MICOS complex subunit MIC25 n=1 Tax=Amblyraja radiata TaxID=386614 RepID=UPI001401FC59|nr:MICOS complex subunit MIC25 [Amblyraja radiata]